MKYPNDIKYLNIGISCVGCAACLERCPVNAIQMQKDDRGILYPHIDEKLCIRCGRCEKVCESIEHKVIGNIPQKIYALKNKDINIRMKSSSGGLFYGIAKYVIDNGGVVYGCKIDDKFQVIHSRAEETVSMMEFMGSKYVQSDISDIYTSLFRDLRRGVKVMFSGTPCQCASVKRILMEENIDDTNLILVDFLCHGVPSQESFDCFVKYIEKKFGGKLLSIKFRDKEKIENPPSCRGIRFQIKKGSCIEDIYSKEVNDLYFDLFLGNYLLRDCCFECRYTSYKRVSDFTLADYWECQEYHKEFFDTKGISMALLNTDKAVNVFDGISNMYDYVQIEKSEIKQKTLVKSARKRKDFDVFWRVYTEKGFEEAFQYRIKNIKRLRNQHKLKENIKKILPESILLKVRGCKNE